jgi:hypothetical protein
MRPAFTLPSTRQFAIIRCRASASPRICYFELPGPNYGFLQFREVINVSTHSLRLSSERKIVILQTTVTRKRLWPNLGWDS